MDTKMVDGSDPDPRRAGTWMVALGILLVMAGCLLLIYRRDTGTGHYLSSPGQNGSLLIGLGGLCLIVGLMNIRGSAQDDEGAAAS